jgi:hypothetical protein
MWDSTTTPPPSAGRWPPRETLLPAAVLATYGLLRVVGLLWGIVRGSPPASLLAWASVISDAAAAVQGFAATAVLIVPGLRRQRFAWSVGTVAVAAALLGAAVWVVRGDVNAMVRVREILLALGLAIATAAVCGWRPAWALRDDGELDLARLRRALRITALSSAAVGAVSGIMIFTTDPAGAVRRFAVLLLQLGLWGAVVIVLSLMLVVGEQRRLASAAARHELYQRLAERRPRDDDM